MNNGVFALAVNGTDLYAGGTFTTAGGKPSPYIGQWLVQGTESVDEKATGNPDGYTLSQNYPNPFNASTIIEFRLQRTSSVELSVWNIRGQRVRTLISSLLETGSHRAVWDGKNDAGVVVGSGVYLYRLNTPRYAATKKVLLLK
jgi:hypothetical protein